MENQRESSDLKEYYESFKELLKKHRYAVRIYFRSKKIYLYACKKCHEEFRLNLDYDKESFINKSNIEAVMICKCGGNKFKRIGERIL